MTELTTREVRKYFPKARQIRFASAWEWGGFTGKRTHYHLRQYALGVNRATAFALDIRLHDRNGATLVALTLEQLAAELVAFQLTGKTSQE